MLTASRPLNNRSGITSYSKLILTKNTVFLSIAWFLLALLFFPYLRYYVDNPDTLSYITVAEKIATGNFSEAVNGYWSPLICWLLVVPFRLHIESITAFKILQLVIGWVAL